MTGALADLAKVMLMAQSRFNRAYCHFWVNEVQPCSDEKAWNLLELLRQKIELFVFKYDRRELGIKHATWELFRLELVGDAGYTFENAMSFVKWYEKLTNRIAQSLGYLYEFHGDTFSDLCDSYPLGGRQLVERALTTHPKSDRPRREGFLEEREVSSAVLEQLGPQWHKLICHGENYAEMALETACKRSFLQKVLTGHNDQVRWTPEEEEEVSFAHLGEDL